MAKLIKHIDKIAREVQRDVLYVEFSREVFPDYEWESYVGRNELIAWLEEQGIVYQHCAPFACEDGWEGYRGQLYIDVPVDDSNEQFLHVDSHLCTPDNSFKIPGIGLYIVTLEQALKNKHHDEPGFWDKWAESF